MTSQRQSREARERVPEGEEQARRDFLKTVGAFPVALAAGGGAVSANADPASSITTPSDNMPQISLGPHAISRVICGANCFNAGSHLSVFVNHAMREYYSEAQILRTLQRCQQVGINCWQAGLSNLDRYRRFTEQGLQMHYISLAAGEPAHIDRLRRGGCFAIAHHGEVTDQMFKRGRLEAARAYLQRIRDAGLVVGVSTHIPDVVDAIESAGWDVDFYMTCVYERHRTRAELEALLGQAPIPVGEVYLPQDPPRMYRVMQQTDKPCLAFKILAAGRLSDRRAWVEAAFREAFESIKPTDGIIVGIYDRYSDQAAENAAFARRYGANQR